MRIRKFAILGVASALALGTGGCVKNEQASSGAAGSTETIAVTIADDKCEVETHTAPSGTIKFQLNNEGPAVNEFEILAEDKLQIVGELENLTAGTQRDFTIQLSEGTYYTACKKNMVGALVNPTEFTVTKGEEVEVSKDRQAAMDKSVEQYTAYVKDQVGQLLAATEEFVEVYKSGDTEKAKELFPLARMHYERIEPTAESFGDIDPQLDERWVDYQEDQESAEQREWTGWHRIEADLWADTEATYLEEAKAAGYTARPEAMDDAKKAEIADLLVQNTQDLYDLVYADDFELDISAIANGAISLVEEVATSKITGEEEAFSHTDLYDFQANIEGARVAYNNVKDFAEASNPENTKQIDTDLKAVEDLLAQYNQGTAEDPVYPDYTTVTDAQRKDITNKIDALRKSLATLTQDTLEIPAEEEEEE